MTSPGPQTRFAGDVDPGTWSRRGDRDLDLDDTLDLDLDLTAPVDARPRDAARLRRVRLAFLAATVSTFIALASHVLAGGGMPGVLGVAFPFGLAVLACLLLARIRTDSLRLGLSVGASQFLFHTLFVLGTPPTAGGATDAHAGHAGHGQLAAASAMADFASTAGAGAPAAAVHLGHDGPLMWAMHALAAALTALALYFGEALVSALTRAKAAAAELLPHLVRSLLLLHARAVRPAVVADSTPLELPWVPALTVRVERAQRRRGPPALAMTSAFATSN
ncbi:hypothetical protein [Pseudoclavibacter helvolus]|uniref:hypothetical protein n=1 Tax=Pseudoclavibacter helvolus TaxID=255205 RepID=UPI003C775160